MNTAEILACGLSWYERKANSHLLELLADELEAWRRSSGRAERKFEAQPFIEVADFLKLRLLGALAEVLDLRRKYAEYTKRYSRASSQLEKDLQVIEFAKYLGSSGAGLRGDRKALRRWFGHDAITERYVVRCNRVERLMTFVLERLGAAARGALEELDEGFERLELWKSLSLEKTLKGLLSYDGDCRVPTAAIRGLRTALESVPPASRGEAVDDATVQFFYKCAVHPKLDVWLQCEALEILALLSPSALIQVAEHRLRKPGDDADLFVRRRAVDLIAAHVGEVPQALELLPVLAKDPSAYVRQGVALALRCLPAADAAKWFKELVLRDAIPQVRAAALLQCLDLIERRELREAILDVGAAVPSSEADGYVIRILCHVSREGAKKLVASGDPFLKDWTDAAAAWLSALRRGKAAIPVKRWAAQAAEAIWCETDPSARRLRAQLSEVLERLRCGEEVKLPAEIELPADEDWIGRVLAVASQDDFGSQIDVDGSRPKITRGWPFVNKAWRLLHELRNPSPDKRQAFAHGIARRFRGRIQAPSAIVAELAETRVPGEPLFIAEEGGWRPYLPLLDQALACLGRPVAHGGMRIYTAEGVTELIAPDTARARLKAFWRITNRFADIAKLRNWRSQLQESPATYAKELSDLGFRVEVRPHAAGMGRAEPAVDPDVRRFFPAALPLVPAELWARLQDYFVSVYDNSLRDLAVFIGGATGLFLGRHVYMSLSLRAWRRKICFVVGGWGTRGKSGTERLKAALFNAVGYGVVSKTTGCEAMFLCAQAFGKTREMFLFRSYDKATIWEQRNVIRIARQMGAEVFLWECMALTPSYVEVLQQNWVRDDISTITNTYPDHEDLQGPAGINIPEVIGVFIPTRSTVVTTEEVMLPILKEIAKKKATKLRPVDWIPPGLIAPDVLKRFPYEEHPANVALVLALASELGIREDFALREMADRVVPDLGVLKTSPIARIRGRRLQFSNGCSANERHGTISNWIRCGFDKQDPIAEPGVWITTVVNNRADRVPRSRVFARILVEDIYADRHFLIGGNLPGLVGYINQSWDSYAPTISLWPKDSVENPLGVLFEMARRFRVPSLPEHVLTRLRCMASCGGEVMNVEGSKDGLCSDLTELRQKLVDAGLAERADAIIRHHKANIEAYQELEVFRRRIGRVTADERESLDREFRELLRVWFTRKIVVVDDYYISGDQLINLIAEETPPGYMNRVMGIQNIKGTGLDFVYRWQAWDTCWRACEQLQSKDAAEAERGLRALSAFHEYGVLCLEHVREALTAVRQSPAARGESFHAELAVIQSNYEAASKVLEIKLRAVRKKAGKFERIVAFAESLLDAGDAAKRRKKANQIYRDLVKLRISYERAALELQYLNKRQKGGWLLESVAKLKSEAARRFSELILRVLKGR